MRTYLLGDLTSGLMLAQPAVDAGGKPVHQRPLIRGQPPVLDLHQLGNAQQEVQPVVSEAALPSTSERRPLARMWLSSSLAEWSSARALPKPKAIASSVSSKTWACRSSHDGW